MGLAQDLRQIIMTHGPYTTITVKEYQELVEAGKQAADASCTKCKRAFAKICLECHEGEIKAARRL